MLLWKIHGGVPLERLARHVFPVQSLRPGDVSKRRIKSLLCSICRNLQEIAMMANKASRHAVLVCVIVSVYGISFPGSASDDLPSLTPYPEEVAAVIGRGLVAFPKGGGKIFLSWRLTPSDPRDVSFNVYRREAAGTEALHLIASTRTTSFIDPEVETGVSYTYRVVPVAGEVEAHASGDVTITASLNAGNAIVFRIGEPYQFIRAATGDLDGDGELDMVIAYANAPGVDPWGKAWHESGDTIKVAAFLRSGSRLWTLDLGGGIETGWSYAPMLVWDIDADGRAEVLLKTNKSSNPFDYTGERLTILDGETGQVDKVARWPGVDGISDDDGRGDDYNSSSRNYLAVAHLDGENVYIIAGRGLYKGQKIWAYGKELELVWERFLGLDLYRPESSWERLRKLWHQDHKVRRILAAFLDISVPIDRTTGSHDLPIVDINDDGKEEIMWGEHAIGEDGKDVWVVTDRMPYKGHPDLVYLADIVPRNPGKEVLYFREGWYRRTDDGIGVLVVNNNGESVWGRWGYTHVDGGWAAPIIPDARGMQVFAYDIHSKDKKLRRKVRTTLLWDAEGNRLPNPPESWILSAPLDWDGDGISEILLRSGDVSRHDGSLVVSLGKSPLWAADLLGDHRDEVVLATGDGEVHIVFNTGLMGSEPAMTKVADRRYRNDLSRTAMDYFPRPTEGGYIPRHGTGQ
jgi:hypothetical protein